MTKSDTTDALIASLRTAEAPEILFPLAATAAALMTNADRPGSLLIVHLALLTIARRVDDEPLTKRDWSAIQAVLCRLADLLQVQIPDELDSLGTAWRAWAQPSSLQ